MICRFSNLKTVTLIAKQRASIKLVFIFFVHQDKFKFKMGKKKNKQNVHDFPDYFWLNNKFRAQF